MLKHCNEWHRKRPDAPRDELVVKVDPIAPSPAKPAKAVAKKRVKTPK